MGRVAENYDDQKTLLRDAGKVQKSVMPANAVIQVNLVRVKAMKPGFPLCAGMTKFNCAENNNDSL